MKREVVYMELLLFIMCRILAAKWRCNVFVECHFATGYSHLTIINILAGAWV